MRRLRAILFTLLLAAFTIHMLWIAVGPLMPYLVASTVVVVAVGFVYYRFTRW